MATQVPPPEPPEIDVELLVGELRERAAALRAGGAYGPDVGTGPLNVGAGRPEVRFRPQLGYSSKPGVGRAITGVKQLQLRLLFHVLDDLARQADAAVAALSARLDGCGDVSALFEAEAAERTRAQTDIAAVSRRLDAFERRVEELQLGPRLARLERAPRSPAPPPAGEAVAEASPPPPREDLRIDYESFEGRYRPEESVRGHQRPYLEDLRDAGSVVDVGCGRGELVEMLNAEGVSAYGVDMDPDFVALAAERGVPVRHGDGVAHVAALQAGSVGGVVASHVVEHLEPQDVLRLVHGAFDALAPGGVLIMETPNPESLVAGSVNFHRDLTHRRPIHPDTLAFLCESAGFSEVEVRRMSPVPDADRLPAPPEDAPGADYLRGVVDRLNSLVYGFQDYAVVARR